MKIFTKGSPEAREHMARLRAMRGKKRNQNPLTGPEFRDVMDASRRERDLAAAYATHGLKGHAAYAQGRAIGQITTAGRHAYYPADKKRADMSLEVALDENLGYLPPSEVKRIRRGIPVPNPLTRSEAKGILASSRSAYEQSQRWAKTGPAGQNRKLLLGWAHGHATALHQYGKSRHDRMAAGELMLREDNPSMPERVRETHGEVCACGHLRAIHKDTVQGLAIGHGACTARACPCKKYTWTPQRAAFLNPCRGANPFVCPVCGGELVHMGNLGPLAYYRCRQCGMETSRPHRKRKGNPPMLILGNPGQTKKRPRRSERGWSKPEFVSYLRRTLIPDLRDMGMINTARDFNTVVKFISKPHVHRADGFTRQEFVIYLTGTLIPDLLEMGHVHTAEDFQTAVNFLDYPHGWSGWASNPSRYRRQRRQRNPNQLPPEIANDPRFKKELAAYRKRHGNGPVRITKINVPKGYPKFMSSWGKAPHVVYDAPGHSNKGKRIHKFGERGGRPPHLVSSVERGKKFLAYAGGTFDAGGEWIHR